MKNYKVTKDRVVIVDIYNEKEDSIWKLLEYKREHKMQMITGVNK